jgi:hypothetical protein
MWSCANPSSAVRAEFHREAMQHSRSTWAGVGTDVLPWRAVQIGALDVLKRNAGRECWGGTPSGHKCKLRSEVLPETAVRFWLALR